VYVYTRLNKDFIIYAEVRCSTALCQAISLAGGIHYITLLGSMKHLKERQRPADMESAGRIKNGCQIRLQTYPSGPNCQGLKNLAKKVYWDQTQYNGAEVDDDDS
jgi:hypothetical protein